jgi:hypothetical protein
MEPKKEGLVIDASVEKLSDRKYRGSIAVGERCFDYRMKLQLPIDFYIGTGQWNAKDLERVPLYVSEDMGNGMRRMKLTEEERYFFATVAGSAVNAYHMDPEKWTPSPKGRIVKLLERLGFEFTQLEPAHLLCIPESNVPESLRRL